MPTSDLLPSLLFKINENDGLGVAAPQRPSQLG